MKREEQVVQFGQSTETKSTNHEALRLENKTWVQILVGSFTTFVKLRKPCFVSELPNLYNEGVRLGGRGGTALSPLPTLIYHTPNNVNLAWKEKMEPGCNWLSTPTALGHFFPFILIALYPIKPLPGITSWLHSPSLIITSVKTGCSRDDQSVA